MSTAAESIAKLGDIVAYRDFDEPLANLFDMPISRAKNALSMARYRTQTSFLPLASEVIYVGNDGVNAFARQIDPSQCLICFFSGTVVALLDACLNLASRMNPSTGLPAHESEKLLVFPDRIPLLGSRPSQGVQNATEILEQLRRIANRGLPNAELGVLLFELATWFIAMHEVMHVVLGHARYLWEHMRLDGLLEFSESRELLVPHEFSQMLEFSADRHACRGIARRILMGDIDASYEESLFSRLATDRKDFLIGTLTTALVLLLHLFPKRYCSIDRIFGSHPHPYIRMQWMAMELHHEIKGEVDFESSVMKPLAETSATLKANFDSPDNWWSYAESDLSGRELGTPPTDLLYREVVSITKQRHNELAAFAPVYPQPEELVMERK